MKRKKELYEDFKRVEKELKALSETLKDETSIPSEDEIHGFAIKMNTSIANLEKIKEEVLEFYRS